ncbi:MAG TPA: hypothetical protein VFR14_07300 [Candidatus Limnocylindrales bacterium]|nr:hypothetical protein [Candidatus Limnocylindrales bacterium]
MGRRGPIVLATSTGIVALVVVVLLDSGRDLEPQRTASPTIEASDLNPRDLAMRVWYSLAAVHPGQDSLAGFDLAYGTLGGTSGEITQRYGPLAPASEMKGALPFARGPFGEAVLYGFWTGEGSELHLLAPGTGDDRVLVSGPDIIHDAVLDTPNETAYFLTVDPISRQPNAIYRVGLAQLDSPMLVTRLAGSPADDTVASDARLYVTPADYLAVMSCPADCTLRWYRATDGSNEGEVGFDPPARVAGASDDTLWLAPQCGENVCPIIMVSLSTGASATFGFLCTTATIVHVEGSVSVVSDAAPGGKCISPDYAVTRFDRPEADPILLATFPDRMLALLEQGSNVGVELPDGWVILGPSGSLPAGEFSAPGPGPVLIRISDGQRLTLPNFAAP